MHFFDIIFLWARSHKVLPVTRQQILQSPISVQALPGLAGYKPMGGKSRSWKG